MSEVEAAKRVAGRFAGLVTDARPFGAGHINDTFLVAAPAGELVVQRINTAVFPDPEAVTANILAVWRHLDGDLSTTGGGGGPHRAFSTTGRAQELVPEPVATSAGEWLVRDGDAWWRAWRRVPEAEPLPGAGGSPAGEGGVGSVAGSPAGEGGVGSVAGSPAGEGGVGSVAGKFGGGAARPEPGGPAALFSAGALLGRFHRRVADLDPDSLVETIPGFHNPGRRLDALRAMISADPCGRVADVGPEIEAAFADEPLVDVAEGLAARVPRRVAHFDAKLDNILFRAGEAVCLVDLDTLMPGAWFWDVGDLLRSGSAPGAEDDPDPERATAVPGRYRAILDGYRESVAGVAEPAEIEAAELAGAVITYEQAVRFLTDWIAGDVYYRISRPTQNLDRTRAQFRLLASLPR